MVPRFWVWAVIGPLLSLAPACAPARHAFLWNGAGSGAEKTVCSPSRHGVLADGAGPHSQTTVPSAEPLPPPNRAGQSPYHQQLPPVAPPPEPSKPSPRPPVTRETPGLWPAAFRNVEPSREVITAASRPTPAPVAEFKPRPPDDAPLVAALRCYLDRRPAQAVAALEGLPRPTQDVLLGLLPTMTRLAELNLEKADPKEVATVTAQLESVLAPLRRRAPLVVGKMCFCRGIEQFGRYEPLPPETAFRPGEWVEVYVELHNFTIEQQGRQFVTRLVSSLKICDFYDKEVWRKNIQPERGIDVSQSPRHDFYNRYYFQVPQPLSPGMYTLEVVVTDVPTGRTARRSLDFRVTAAPLRGT